MSDQGRGVRSAESQTVVALAILYFGVGLC